jgi:DHA1 family bicyclomycin/chloramphenicol resistance-like MFS transporter
MTQTTKKPQISILFFLFTLANVLGVLYAAALPGLKDYFQVTKAAAQQTGSFYLVGCLLAQVVYAPLAKALGRKPAIYIGCSLALLGSLLCLVAIETQAFSLLLFGRVLTAFGAACGVTLTSILISDSLSLHEQKKILSYLMTSFAIIPAIGVTVGGFITEYISWQGCFYFMLFYSVVVSVLCLWLPETAKDKGSHHLHVMRIAKSYFHQFSQLLPALYALIYASSAIILYAFSMEAPFIAKNQLHMPADRFGLYNLIPNIGLFLGGIASAQLSHRLSSKTLIFLGGCGFFLFSAAMWVFFEMNLINAFTLFGMPLLVFFVTPTILSHGQASSLAASEDKVYASSALYIFQYFSMFLSIIILGLFPAQDASALPIVYSCAGFLILALWAVVQILPKKRHS